MSRRNRRNRGQQWPRPQQQEPSRRPFNVTSSPRPLPAQYVPQMNGHTPQGWEFGQGGNGMMPAPTTRYNEDPRAVVHAHPDYQALEMQLAEVRAGFEAFVQNAGNVVPLHVTLIINPINGRFSYTYTDGLLPHIAGEIDRIMPGVAQAIVGAMSQPEPQVYDPRQPRNPLTHPLGGDIPVGGTQ